VTQTGQGAASVELQALAQHRNQAQLRLSDVQVQLDQLQEQKELADPKEKLRFNQPIAELTHQRTVALLDLDATRARIATLQAPQAPAPGTIQHVRMPHVTRKEAETAGIGAFLLMFPLVIALARRIWVRGGATAQRTVDLESSPRLQRMEEAIEAISIEVERIGEGQRFATRLLAERSIEPALKRATPPESPSARRTPGMITPH
jgi:hypothetical protein